MEATAKEKTHLETADENLLLKMRKDAPDYSEKKHVGACLKDEALNG